MRIAVCSNLFPPLWLGGYETGAAEVVHELRRRGHEVLVFTSSQAWIWEAGRFECRAQPDLREQVDLGPCVLGPLTRMPPWRIAGLLLAARRARKLYRRALEAFAPELVLLFNPLGLLTALPADLLRWGRQRGVPVRFYVSDPWLAEWPRAHPLLRLLQRCTFGWFGGGALPALGAEQVVFCSRYLREAAAATPFSRDAQRSAFVGQDSDPDSKPKHHRIGILCHNNALRCASRLNETSVLPWGLAHLDQCPPLPLRHFQGEQPLTLVYAGQVQPHKGLDLLLHALAGCRERQRLVVVGDDRTDHAAACRVLASQLGLERQVQWQGPCAPGQLPSLLPKLGQVLVVPSRWQEPFSRVVLEGLAAGLAVVASHTGGTPEAITMGRTGFLFDPDRPEELTALLDWLESNRRPAWLVGRRGQRAAQRRFSIERMVDRLLAGPHRKEAARAHRVQSLAGGR